MVKFAVLDQVTWRSLPLATFSAMTAEIEARFGPPSVRDLDSSGLGPVDAHLLRFSCGLELALWRFQLGPQGEPIDAAVEPCWYDVYASEPVALDHVAFHLELAGAQLGPALEGPDGPRAAAAARSVRVMRTDDNGNDVEVARVTSRCEAEALAAEYERRGHKQLYWIAEIEPAAAGRAR